MNKEILELLHKQDSFYFLLGSLISADNNMTKEEECNKEDIRSIVELLEEMITEGNTTIPEEFLVGYHKLALNSLKVFDK